MIFFFLVEETQQSSYRQLIKDLSISITIQPDFSKSWIALQATNISYLLMRPDKKEKNQYVKRKNYFRSWNAECKTIEKYEKQKAVVDTSIIVLYKTY